MSGVSATYSAGNLVLDSAGLDAIPTGSYDLSIFRADDGSLSPLASDQAPLSIHNLYFLHYGLGGPILATSIDGHTVWQRQYLPFGGPLLDENAPNDFTTSNANVNLGFVGRQFDEEVGLYQLGARWYDPDGLLVSVVE